MEYQRRPKFISEGKKGNYNLMKINYEKGEIEEDNCLIPYKDLTGIGFEKSKGFSSGTLDNSDNKELSDLELKNKALKRLEEGLISEAKIKQADFILIDTNTNEGRGKHWRFDVHYKFFVKI